MKFPFTVALAIFNAKQEANLFLFLFVGVDDV